MADSISNSTVTTFSGEGFQDWSKKTKQRLISEGLWPTVAEGSRNPNQTEETMSAEEMQQAKINDLNALKLINESLSPSISVTICHATTAKQAWETLHSNFQAQSKMKEREDESVEESSGEIGVMPLSGKKPFFDMVIVKAALKPRCQMYFPSRVNHLLPSTNMVAQVKLLGKVYDVYFVGERRQKTFGAGWRQLVEEHGLNVGDFVVFEIMEKSESKLEMNMQILRPEIPPELEQEMRKRGLLPDPTAVIEID